MIHKFTIKGQKGDAFIRITSGCKDVQVVFCENEDTVQEEVTWESQQAHKMAMIFAQIMGEYIKLAPYYDELIMKGENLAAELLGQELTPTFVAGEPLDDEDFGEITFEPDFDLNGLKDIHEKLLFLYCRPSQAFFCHFWVLFRHPWFPSARE